MDQEAMHHPPKWLQVCAASLSSVLPCVAALSGRTVLATCRADESKHCNSSGQINHTWNDSWKLAPLETSTSIAASPALQDLYSSGYLTELHAFSKMLHGVATLLPDALQVRFRGTVHVTG